METDRARSPSETSRAKPVALPAARRHGLFEEIDFQAGTNPAWGKSTRCS